MYIDCIIIYSCSYVDAYCILITYNRYVCISSIVVLSILFYVYSMNIIHAQLRLSEA